MTENIFHSVNRVSAGTILDCVFVKDSTTENDVEVAGSGAVCAGVTRKGKGKALESYDDVTNGNVAALAGDEIEVIVDGYALVRAGGTVTRGKFVKPDTLGRALNSTAGDPSGGVAMQSATTANELIIVKILPYLDAAL